MKLSEMQLPIGVLMLTAVLAGCAGYGNAPLDKQGAAYHQISEHQTAYPEKEVADGNPNLDGSIAARVIKTYRADAGDRQAVKNTIEVNIGRK
ncbi:MAG: hypothetical protein KC477_07660 [Oceanospirillaceae bacterium]|nr:hypothetical protein [Oceanospirillaceae bacterium]